MNSVTVDRLTVYSSPSLAAMAPACQSCCTDPDSHREDAKRKRMASASTLGASTSGAIEAVMLMEEKVVRVA